MPRRGPTTRLRRPVLSAAHPNQIPYAAPRAVQEGDEAHVRPTSPSERVWRRTTCRDSCRPPAILIGSRPVGWPCCTARSHHPPPPPFAGGSCLRAPPGSSWHRTPSQGSAYKWLL